MATITAMTNGVSGTLTNRSVPATAPMTPATARTGRSRVSWIEARSRNARNALASTLGKAITTTAVSMSTNRAAIGMAITGNPIPVTALATDPMITATSTITSSVAVTPAVCRVDRPSDLLAP